MKNIAEFLHRANINYFNYGKKDILIYDDHRTLFAVIAELKRNKLISDIPNLFYFDYHDDCVVPRALPIEQRRNQLNLDDQKAIWSYAEFDLAPLDDDWLTALMDLDLIKDAVVIGVEEDNNIHDLNLRYQDSKEPHYLYKMSHLDCALGVRGELEDSQTDRYKNHLRRLFNRNVPDGEMPIESPFILDFDLDCFTTTCCGKRVGWPERVFVERYVDNLSARCLMNELIANAQLITICREPEYCGGFGESNKILSFLDSYFFGGSLNTQPLFW